MNDITIFNHLGNDIRVMTDEQGEPLFVLKDICDALNLGNTSRVADRLDAEDFTLSKVIDNRGVQQKTFLVSEAGLYEVIIRSDKPEAKAFRNGQGKIIPMQDAVNRGILILTERIDTAGKIRPQLLVTPAAQSYFANILSA